LGRQGISALRYSMSALKPTQPHANTTYFP
jgi:hypothetical protein